MKKLLLNLDWITPLLSIIARLRGRVHAMRLHVDDFWAVEALEAAGIRILHPLFVDDDILFDIPIRQKTQARQMLQALGFDLTQG